MKKIAQIFAHFFPPPTNLPLPGHDFQYHILHYLKIISKGSYCKGLILITSNFHRVISLQNQKKI